MHVFCQGQSRDQVSPVPVQQCQGQTNNIANQFDPESGDLALSQLELKLRQFHDNQTSCQGYDDEFLGTPRPGQSSVGVVRQLRRFTIKVLRAGFTDEN